jgi:hypothetical protein
LRLASILTEAMDAAVPDDLAFASQCTSGIAASNLAAESHWGEKDFRLAAFSSECSTADPLRSAASW